MLFVQLHVSSGRAAQFVVSVTFNGEMLANLALSLEDPQDDVSNQHQTVPDADENVSISRSAEGIETQVDGGERQNAGNVTKSPTMVCQFQILDSRVESKLTSEPCRGRQE